MAINYGKGKNTSNYNLGAGAGVSPDSEKEKPGFMFGAVIVILCSAAHLVTTL